MQFMNLEFSTVLCTSTYTFDLYFSSYVTKIIICLKSVYFYFSNHN